MAVVLLAAAGVLAERGLLSARPPSEPREAPRAAPTRASAPVSIVVREGRQLVRYHEGGATRVAELPKGAGSEAPLWIVEDAGQSAAVFGVDRGQLFRIDIPRRQSPSTVGRVDRIVSEGPDVCELLVEVADDPPAVVVLDTASGNVVDRRPFPGYDGSGGWTPRGAITTFGLPGLVLSRPGRAGRDEVAVAWSKRGVASGFVPSRLQQLGQPGRLLGIADDWILFLDDACPGRECVLRVLSFTRDGASVRPVRPPQGWSFQPGETSGGSHEALVPVVNTHDSSVRALARLVPGGDMALLLRASVGLEPRAGLVAEPDGSVYFLLIDRVLDRVLARWSPADAPHVVTFPQLPRLPVTARLVCACR